MPTRHRIFAIASVATLAAGLMVTRAHAAKPTCLGERATIVAKASDKVTKGTKGDDVIVGTKGDDVIKGKGGNDIICGGGGDDILLGGGGDDILFGGGGDDKLNGGAGDDFVFGGNGNDILKGGTLTDLDQLFGGPGDDRIKGNGDDTANFSFSPNPVQVDLAVGVASGEGNDTLIDVNHVAGSEFDDVLVGNAATNFLFGLGGNDVINGGEALDIIIGGPGDDDIDGGGGFDLIDFRGSTASVEVDLAKGTADGETDGSDTLDSIEAIAGTEFDDVLIGNNGDNYLFGMAGNDTIDGGEGFDYAGYWFEAGPVNADLSTGSATVLGDTDTLIDIEGLFGTINFDDVLTGDDGDNFLDGDGGDDILNGGGGNDWLLGGAGDDQINGGPGDYDLADFFTNEPITANLATGVATGEGNDTLTGIEALGGTDQPDVLIGDDNTNYLFGWGGDDQIFGGGGDDFINGMAGNDTIDGGEGFDSCVAEVVAPTSCEAIITAEEIPTHPLQVVAEAAENFRRSF